MATIRGTTPTVTFNLPFDVSTIQNCEVYFAQNDELLVTKGYNDCVLSGTTLSVTLKQKDTLQFDDEEKLQAFEEAVADLPENYREAIVWGCLSDLSGHDAAEKLGCSENTLYQRVFQAKQMLKKALMKEDEE